MKIRQHARPTRIAEGPAVELIPGPSRNINNRRHGRPREEETMLTRQQRIMPLTTAEIEICSRLGLDPATYADHSHQVRQQERGTRRPLSAEREIHARLGIDEREPEEVDIGRLAHAMKFLAPQAAREMTSWRNPDHHVTAAIEAMKAWKPGNVDRLAESAAHLVCALAKSGVGGAGDAFEPNPPIDDEDE